MRTLARLSLLPFIAAVTLTAQAIPATNPLPPDSALSQPKPHANWARRHAVLLSGIVMTGAGAAMIASPGSGQVSGCFNSGINGSLQCATVSTWGASGKHIGGILLVSGGLPLSILGLIKHH